MGLDRLSKRKTVRNAFRAAVAAAALSGAPDVQAQTKGDLRHSESVHAKTRPEMVVSPEGLDEAIRDVENGLAPGGRYSRIFDDPNSSLEAAGRVLRYINRVIEHLEVAQHFPDMYGDQTETLRRKVPPLSHFHGATSVKFHARLKDGGVKESHCGGYHVALNGESFFATAKHCVEGKLEENQFFTPGYNVADIAVRYEPHYRGPALTLDTSLSDKDVQGKMVVLQGKRLGKPLMRISFLIKMSPILYQKIFKTSPDARDWLSSQFASTFMMPLQPGDATKNDDGTLPAQGMSGAVVAPWVRGGYRASGPFFGTVHWSSVPNTQQKGLSSAMGFVQGVDVLKDACNKARSLSEAPGWVTRIKENR